MSLFHDLKLKRRKTSSVITSSSSMQSGVSELLSPPQPAYRLSTSGGSLVTSTTPSLAPCVTACHESHVPTKQVNGGGSSSVIMACPTSYPFTPHHLNHVPVNGQDERMIVDGVRETQVIKTNGFIRTSVLILSPRLCPTTNNNINNNIGNISELHHKSPPSHHNLVSPAMHHAVHGHHVTNPVSAVPSVISSVVPTTGPTITSAIIQQRRSNSSSSSSSNSSSTDTVDPVDQWGCLDLSSKSTRHSSISSSCSAASTATSGSTPALDCVMGETPVAGSGKTMKWTPNPAAKKQSHSQQVRLVTESVENGIRLTSSSPSSTSSPPSLDGAASSPSDSSESKVTIQVPSILSSALMAPKSTPSAQHVAMVAANAARATMSNGSNNNQNSMNSASSTGHNTSSNQHHNQSPFQSNGNNNHNNKNNASHSQQPQTQHNNQSNGGATGGQEEEEQPMICMICEDRATGLHYGIITCEGCKGFFKRTVQNKRVYTCVADGECSITKQQRNRCQYCRFQKCLRQGMVLAAVREDRMPGGRNSGAVYNLYKVKYKKHKKNTPTTSQGPASNGQSVPQTNGQSNGQSNMQSNGQSKDEMGILKSALTSPFPVNGSRLCYQQSGHSPDPGSSSSPHTASSRAESTSSLSPPSSRPMDSYQPPPASQQESGCSPTPSPSPVHSRTPSPPIKSTSSPPNRLPVSRVIGGTQYILQLTAATAAALHQKEVDDRKAEAAASLRALAAHPVIKSSDFPPPGFDHVIPASGSGGTTALLVVTTTTPATGSLDTKTAKVESSQP